MSRNTRTPLENIAEERVVLGQLLQAESNFWRVNEVLRAFHFAKPIHQAIYQTINDLLMDGKKLSLAVLQARLGDEYSDGDNDDLSTMSLLTALLRDAESGDLEGVEVIVDLWKRRMHIAELKRAMKEAEDPNAHIADLMASHEARVEDINTNGMSVPIRTIGQAAAEVMDFSAKANQTGRLPGFDTGLPSLDQIMGRIHPGDLGVVAAARGDGKTILAAQFASHMQNRAPAILFELEMKDMDIAARALAGLTNHSVSTIESGAFDQFDLEELLAAKERLANSRFYVDDRPRLTIEQIHDRCATMKRSKGLGVAIIDHFRLVQTRKPFRDKADRMAHISSMGKSMAKDLGIAVIFLSQVTRMSQRRDDHPEPRLNDLEGWGALEQDADWAIGAFRRDRWLKGQKPHDTESQQFRNWSEKMTRHKRRIEITTLKGRRVEDGEMREFNFDGRAGLISEIER